VLILPGGQKTLSDSIPGISMWTLIDLWLHPMDKLGSGDGIKRVTSSYCISWRALDANASGDSYSTHYYDAHGHIPLKKNPLATQWPNWVFSPCQLS
jgi:hypothetical protein